MSNDVLVAPMHRQNEYILIILLTFLHFLCSYYFLTLLSIFYCK